MQDSEVSRMTMKKKGLCPSICHTRSNKPRMWLQFLCKGCDKENEEPSNQITAIPKEDKHDDLIGMRKIKVEHTPLKVTDRTMLENILFTLQGEIQKDLPPSYSLSQLDVSSITSMHSLFFGFDFDTRNCSHMFDLDISQWDVSNVNNMESMFQASNHFNQPLNAWNVSNVTNMKYTFRSCSMFNQPLDAWDVSQVVTMECMFCGCISFNQDLSSWQVYNVMDMSNLFTSCFALDQSFVKNWKINPRCNTRNMLNPVSSSWRGGKKQRQLRGTRKGRKDIRRKKGQRSRRRDTRGRTRK